MKRLSWLRTVLFAVFVASLVGNFFSLGYVLKTKRDAPAMSILAESAFSAYPEEVRLEFRRLLRDNRPQTIEALRKLREARRKLASVASSSSLNEADVTKAMADVRNATDALQRLMQNLLLNALRSTDRAKSAS
ncbi:periplasmic heavy metal sensor [Sinorhizobium meliloti]|uniref:periplasmic heavy metal sensor n=1 Tax=Rhizobium meliloti TaxID=382 RepID=UPI000FD189AC|nr:periplasmic heavy metal sensor [Sinorhizobium meliloti]RVO43552.1 periplasmic heavy metal sensor [Sinorhizobium meliloti]UIJ91618.1 periplasmic heavy metal sensor [Sinorhizobium meliloti]WKL24363.1 periplasmic heavy metal sensor [Sinorhizobium meliloti]WKL28358.1 periplasmic heavy metal sensor [Sinorhizobium meliloti]WKL33919.1 periplasmic heavy metal sensor [Sinorhizobium meliloti]